MGTQAAIIEIYVGITTDAGVPQVQIAFQNRGHTIVTVNGSVDVIRLWPDGREIVLTHGDISSSPVSVDRGLIKTYPFIGVNSGFTYADWKEMSNTETVTPAQVFKVKGMYSYNDGFDDISSNIPFCYSWLAHPEMNFITGTFSGRAQMTTEGAGASFQKCEMWDYQANWIKEQLAES